MPSTKIHTEGSFAEKLKWTNKRLRRDLDNLVIRDWLRRSIANFNELETYVIYDGNKIAIYDESAFQIKKDMKAFKTYYISKPLRSIAIE